MHEEPEDMELKNESLGMPSTSLLAENLLNKNLNVIISPKYYSSSERSFRITAWCLRIVNNCWKDKLKWSGELDPGW